MICEHVYRRGIVLAAIGYGKQVQTLFEKRIEIAIKLGLVEPADKRDVPVRDGVIEYVLQRQARAHKIRARVRHVSARKRDYLFAYVVVNGVNRKVHARLLREREHILAHIDHDWHCLIVHCDLREDKPHDRRAHYDYVLALFHAELGKRVYCGSDMLDKHRLLVLYPFGNGVHVGRGDNRKIAQKSVLFNAEQRRFFALGKTRLFAHFAGVAARVRIRDYAIAAGNARYVRTDLGYKPHVLAHGNNGILRLQLAVEHGDVRRRYSAH